MRNLILGAGLLLWTLGPLHAQQVNPCEVDRSYIGAIPEPLEKYSKSFANGKVRVSLVDYDAPGSGPIFLHVLSPPYEDGTRQCRFISLDDTFGFGDMAFDQLKSSYDPVVGLSFQVPVKTYQPENEIYQPAILVFSLNQATGVIKAKLPAPN